MSHAPEPSEPRTVGDVRRLLAELGNPWTVDPSLADDDPIPDYHRGGQPENEIPAGLLPPPLAPGADLTERISAVPPANRWLRARRAELGLLPADDATGGGGQS
jgi:hypothetical protein